MYYRKGVCTTEKDCALHKATVYYRKRFRLTQKRFCTTKINFVLRKVILYDRRPFVLQKGTVYYRKRACTTESHSVLETERVCIPQKANWYHRKRFYTTESESLRRSCTTQGDLVLHTVTLYYRERLCITESYYIFFCNLHAFCWPGRSEWAKLPLMRVRTSSQQGLESWGMAFPWAYIGRSSTSYEAWKIDKPI